MKNKVCLVFGILFLAAGSVWAQKPKDIPITIFLNDSIDSAGRSKTVGIMGWDSGIYLAIAQVDGISISCKFTINK